LEALLRSSPARSDRTDRKNANGSIGPSATCDVHQGGTMKEELEEVMRLVCAVREVVKDMRFHEDDRDPDSEHSFCIDALNKAATKLEFMRKKEEQR
jgi:hypothetical protein